MITFFHTNVCEVNKGIFMCCTSPNHDIGFNDTLIHVLQKSTYKYYINYTLNNNIYISITARTIDVKGKGETCPFLEKHPTNMHDMLSDKEYNYGLTINRVPMCFEGKSNLLGPPLA